MRRRSAARGGPGRADFDCRSPITFPCCLSVCVRQSHIEVTVQVSPRRRADCQFAGGRTGHPCWRDRRTPTSARSRAPSSHAGRFPSKVWFETNQSLSRSAANDSDQPESVTQHVSWQAVSGRSGIWVNSRVSSKPGGCTGSSLNGQQTFVFCTLSSDAKPGMTHSRQKVICQS